MNELQKSVSLFIILDCKDRKFYLIKQVEKHEF